MISNFEMPAGLYRRQCGTILWDGNGGVILSNYYKIRALASSSPKNQALAFSIIVVFGALFAIWGAVCMSSCWLAIYGFVIIAVGLLGIYLAKRRQSRLETFKNCLCNSSAFVAVESDELLKNRKDLTAIGDITGLYILHNLSKDRYYVGQSATAISRAAAQLLGRGNKDVYADYKYGDSFDVRIVPLEGSGYSNLKDFKCAVVQALSATGELYGRK